MQSNPDGGAAYGFRPRLARLVAMAWVGGLAAVWLLRYDAWAFPFQLAHLTAAIWPDLAIGPHFKQMAIARLWDFGCVAAILATALALGTLMIGRLLPRANLLSALFALAAGLWVLAVAVLLVGAISVARVPWVFAGLLCWLLPAPRRFLSEFYVSTEKISGWSKAMIGCCVVAAALNGIGALSPPFEYDSLEYHLGAPAEYARAGRIIFLPHNFYSNMPQLTEMLYLLGMSTTSDGAAKLLHGTFGVLGAVALYALASRLWSRNVGLTAAALFYCMPYVQDLGQTERIDLATTFFGTLAFGALLMASREQQRAWFWLSALMAGAAVATKWTAVAVVLLPALGFVAVARRSVWAVAGYGIVAVLGVMPWMAKNWLFTGNPVYPLLYGWLPSPHWSAEQAGLFALKHYPTFEWGTLALVAERIWQFSFAEPRAFPLLLMVAPLILLLRKPDGSARQAGWLFVGAYAGWFVLTYRPWRFLFPAYPLAAMVGAWALHRIAQDRVAGWVVRCCVVVVLAVGITALGLNAMVDAEEPEREAPRMTFLHYALGRVSREQFVARMGRGTFEPVLWMNANLDADAKVLYVGEARAYYARHPVVWSTAFDRFPPTNGVTHVYVNFSELARLRDNYGYPRGLNVEALLGGARQIHRTRRGAVYELVH